MYWFNNSAQLQSETKNNTFNGATVELCNLQQNLMASQGCDIQLWFFLLICRIKYKLLIIKFIYLLFFYSWGAESPH